MKTVHLKIMAGKSDAVWALSTDQSAELSISEVPDETDVATVIRHANETAINLPVSKTATVLSYDRLGRGLFVNLNSKS